MKSSKPNQAGSSSTKSSEKTTKKEFYYSPETRDHATPFRLAYERSDLPIRVDHVFRGIQLRWTKDMAEVDFERLLPVACEGLRETKFPYEFLAEETCMQMIDGHPEKVLPVIPYIVQPLKAALRTDDTKIVLKVLKILQKITANVPGGGKALVPYYRQLLPVLGQYKTKNVNLGDGVEYGQWKNQNLADIVEETLQLLEKTGGPDAFINIRYVIPLYESCIGSR